ncbi:hypothetical protein Pelo_13624 [Pelomyxa schiedti]|nr:hypothetical protein Pelo_13624 [Pelomyxa schiedti]
MAPCFPEPYAAIMYLYHTSSLEFIVCAIGILLGWYSLPVPVAVCTSSHKRIPCLFEQSGKLPIRVHAHWQSLFSQSPEALRILNVVCANSPTISNAIPVSIREESGTLDVIGFSAMATDKHPLW